MSFQVCHCGWSKDTSYKGLRIHQGKMGCTTKGMAIPESEQFRFNNYLPQLIYQGPPIKIEEPVMNIIPPLMSGSQQNTWGNPWEDSHQRDSGPLNWNTLVRTEKAPVSTYFTTPTIQSTEDAVFEIITSLMGTQNIGRTQRMLDIAGGAQPSLTPMSQIFGTQANPAAAEVTVKETNNISTVFQTPPQYSRNNQTITNARRTLDFSDGSEQPSLTPMSQIFGTQANPAAAEVTVKETNNISTVFQTPPQYSRNNQTITNVCRTLDFSDGSEQVAQLAWGLPTTSAQETVSLKDREKEKESEKEKEKEREAQKLQKARQDRMKADLQQKIQTREQKMAEVRSSVKACKGDLDAEWLEINHVFSEVMKVVENALQKALQPLDERRQRVKREAKVLVQKLQKEVDKLKMTIDELDKNPTLQVSPQTLGDTSDWKNDTVDTAFSFGTLRTTTAIMMAEIHQELEKLSSVELKRIPTFAVDVKLDPNTAHPSLILSPNGKTVRDGGKNQKVPDAPQRFDMFGSILGLNRLTSGRSYWEVEVSNKTGWDLGVARRDAKRKGKLSLNPDNGYWVTVHYEDQKYAALATPPVSLSLREKPQKVGVFVDYREGLVSFYDVTAKSHIYSFTECSFCDEIFPYFSPHLKQNEKNAHPLIIS